MQHHARIVEAAGVLLGAMLLLGPVAAVGAPASTVTLPTPKLEGKVSVERALRERRSVRAHAATPLTLAEIGQLCWSAQGVTDGKGHRTTPSARATYPLELYVIAGAVGGLPAGVYRYAPATHALTLVTAGDQRADFMTKAVGQGWIAKAPALFVITGTPGRMATMKERAPGFMFVEAGLAQGFFLQATALGLGSTYVGGFKPAEARAALKLPATEEVLGVLPVGRR